MYKDTYKRIEREYEAKRNTADRNFRELKESLYSSNPRLKEIDLEISKCGIQAAKMSLSKTKEEKEKINKDLEKKLEKLKKEKEQIFSSLNIDFNPKYSCEKCNDTGYVEERDDERGVSYGTRLCECHKELLKELSVKSLLRSTPLDLSCFEDFDLNYYSKTKKDGVSPYDKMKTVYNSCIKYAQTFDLDSVSLYFYGRTGLGKTHLSLAIANEAIKKGYTVLYGSTINFLNKIEKEKFGRAEDLETENMLIDVDLLILDDLGAEFTTALTTSVLYNIINSRICRGVPTIISSNLDFHELKERYPESVASRIIGTYTGVNFVGDDVRQIQNNE